MDITDDRLRELIALEKRELARKESAKRRARARSAQLKKNGFKERSFWFRLPLFPDEYDIPVVVYTDKKTALVLKKHDVQLGVKFSGSGTNFTVENLTEKNKNK